MIKRVIFDIDNTLIPWKKEYFKEIDKALTEHGIEHTEEDYQKIVEAFNKYENKYFSFDINLMTEFVREYTKKNYSKELIYDFIKRWSKCTPNEPDKTIVETLEYLKDKYEIVILTDWFQAPQKDRLRKVNILKYFQYVYAAENTKRKPYKEAFLSAIGENKPEECIMIGDNFERDVEGAINAGLEAVYYTKYSTNHPKKETSKKYYTISEIKELKTIL